MKTWILVFVFLAGMFLNGVAQTGFSGEILVDTTHATKGTLAADIDNDGDMDILSAHLWHDKVLLYKNDGNGNFDTLQYIGAYFPDDDISGFCVADLDNDGDQDVIAVYANVSSFYAYIAWYMNIGNDTFDAPQYIGGANSPISSIRIVDMEGDGDLDVLAALKGDERIVWYDNDGNGNFGTEYHIIDINADGVINLRSTDLDNDGDADVLAVFGADNKIAWYENDGNGNFGSQQIITTGAIGALDVYAADLDNDGDADVISASYTDNKIAWYENDGNGNFGAQQVITSGAYGASSVYAADLDNDGDMDVLSASKGDHKVAWYENDGNGNFDVYPIGSTKPYGTVSVYAADLDNDGDVDVLSNKVAWYRNNYYGFTQPENQTGCSNTQQTFTVLPGNAVAFQWQIKTGETYEDLVDDNQYSGSNTATLIISNINMEMDNNHYRCIVTFGNDANGVSNDAVLTVLPAPVTDNIIGNSNPSPFDTCTYAVNLTPGSTYEWSVVGGGIINTDNNFVDVLWGNQGYGSLSVIETASNGCAGEPVELQIIIDVQEIAGKYHIRIFPNPSTGKLFISGEKIRHIEILNQEGKSIQKFPVQRDNIRLDLSQYARGVYFIKFDLKDEAFTRKIILK